MRGLVSRRGCPRVRLFQWGGWQSCPGSTLILGQGSRPGLRVVLNLGMGIIGRDLKEHCSGGVGG